METKNNNFDLKKYFGNFVAFFPVFWTAVANAIDPMRKQTRGLYKTKQLPPFHTPPPPPKKKRRRRRRGTKKNQQQQQQNCKQTNK